MTAMKINLATTAKGLIRPVRQQILELLSACAVSVPYSKSGVLTEKYVDVQTVLQTRDVNQVKCSFGTRTSVESIGKSNALVSAQHYNSVTRAVTPEGINYSLEDQMGAFLVVCVLKELLGDAAANPNCEIISFNGVRPGFFLLDDADKLNPTKAFSTSFVDILKDVVIGDSQAHEVVKALEEHENPHEFGLH